MFLKYLAANASWAFVFGGDIVKLRNAESRFFATKRAALDCAREIGLSVEKNGHVIEASR